MSTHKAFDKICCVVLALTLILTVFFVNAEHFGIQKASTVPGYESALFDTSRVHTIDIIMDDWDEFTQSCMNEEYYTCSVVIDNEAYKNVAIRGKGNTSLSSVTNGRYSYKIEFDHYDSANTYYGLDKLCLNNVIQDNTYMKDYLTYTMMRDMGVAAPLCSYTYITVNGEDWGLYLAVEGVEESFLQRNYGKNYGELYKPDSMSMGGGRGNGNDFNTDDFLQNFDINSIFPSNSNNETQEAVTYGEETTDELLTEEETQEPMTEEATQEIPEEESTTQTEETTISEQTTQNEVESIPENLPDGVTIPDFGGEQPDGVTIPDFGGQMPDGMTPPNFGGQLPDGVTPPDFGGELPDGMTPPDFGGQMPWGINTTDINGNNPAVSYIDNDSASPQVSRLGSISFAPPSDSNIPSDFNIPPMGDMGGSLGNIPSFGGDFSVGMAGGFGGMGSSDVKLQYIDDNADSYSNIFDNAKTDITAADKTRLIEALKKLSSGEDIENTVAVDSVIRYFAVHNFVVNSDSYTGSMIHNYYLYEKDGQLQMIPWDYNLAFGSFMSVGSATSSVNDPVDTPLSVNGSGDRPMIDWIFNSGECTELYHKYLGELLAVYFDSGYFSTMLDSVRAMISPYIEKDPTKFCTYEEFEAGISTLREFCLLRAESIKGQLEGTIGSTSSTQTSDTLIDAGTLDISAMGTMGGNMSFPGGNQAPQGGDKAQGTRPQDGSAPSDQTAGSTPRLPEDFQSFFDSGAKGEIPQPPQNDTGNMQQIPDGFFSSSNTQFLTAGTSVASSLALLGVCILLLVSGIIIASRYKRRR